jgi:SAM-dependent methyltransferase
MVENPPSPIDRKADSQSFDTVASLYDTYRPGYPVELIEDIIDISGIQPEGRILEIGCGTGKATRLFAQRGYTMLCLEPGQNLIEVAAKNLAAYTNVSYIKSRFEEWENDLEPFDLVISAQAFHWVPEEVRYEKTAGVLKPGGHLAPFWNMYPGMQGKIRQELDQVYRQRAPEIVKPEIPLEQQIESRVDSLRASPYFDEVSVRQYPWTAHYETEAYLGLLHTYSDHLRLSEQRRRELMDAIAEVVDRNGGTIDRPYLAVVYLARKNPKAAGD